jgi:hypothetical protein
MRQLAAKVLPPLMMLPLVAVPFAPMTILLWLAGLFATAWSAITLLRLGNAALRRRPVDLRTAIRPSLAVAIFAVVALIARDQATAESAEADAFARNLAQQMKSVCDRDGKCPTAPPGWTANDHGHSRSRYGQTRVDYKILPDRSGFRVTVHHPLEFLRDFDAGVGKPIVEREAIR